MKKLATTLLLVLLLGCATTLHEGPKFAETAAPSGDEALVYIYRNFVPPIYQSPAIYFNSTKIVDLANKGYTNVYVRPGEYLIRSEWSDVSGAPNVQGKAGFAAGQTYFIRLGGDMNPGTVRSTLQSVPTSLGTSEIAECMFVKPEVERVK